MGGKWDATSWIDSNVEAILDVGCNGGALLRYCRERFPAARLVGIEINEAALNVARGYLPDAELHLTGAESLPFPDRSFDRVTCIEVLEHIPACLRERAFREMWRVLKPAGRLILTTPHAGWFDWLDAQNVRFHLPWLYGKLVRSGPRDGRYGESGRTIEYHHHFSWEELSRLAGEGWEVVAVQRGGLLLAPLSAWLSWPFYRMGWGECALRLMIERVSSWDYLINWGMASCRIMIILDREGDSPAPVSCVTAGARDERDR